MMNLDPIAYIEQIDTISLGKEFEECTTLVSLDTLYDTYLGKNGHITKAFSIVKDLEADRKKQVGLMLASIKSHIHTLYEAKKDVFLVTEINASLLAETIDYSIPGNTFHAGYQSLLHKTKKHIEDICFSMGFTVMYGHELVTKYENFEAVNIPLSHPATDMQDTFFLHQTDHRGEELIFRAHTTSFDNHILKKYGAPIKVVVPGKVYRMEKLDASHDAMFYQLEGIYIDENISISDFNTTIHTLLQTIFDKEIKVRTRPGYFPFVEPGFEIDAQCPQCGGNGCKLCKQSGWIEILGAGILHPRVLIEGNIDPKKYTGFAFGIGINRMVAIKHGINDIRLFTNGDMRFTQSFM